MHKLRKNRIIFLALTMIATILYGGGISEEEVAASISRTALQYGINPKVLMSLAGTESDYEPLAITVETTRRKARALSRLREAGIKTIYSPGRKTFHSKQTVISFYPDDIQTARSLVVMLKEAGFIFDVGLMQINSVNFTLGEAPSMLLPQKNIKKAGIVFSHCKKLFKTLKHQVECYNRGGGNLRRALRRNKSYNYFPYWRRFARHYHDLYHVTPK